MGHTIFWHMVWKEYRQQLGLFLALAIGTVVLHGIIAWGASLRDHPLPITAVYHVVLIMPIFYALGCGATLFAGEREMETYSFLAALPQPRWSTFAAKTSVALLSTILLSLVCLATAYVVAQGRWPGTSDAPPVADYALITLEVLAWSSLCSLLLKNPLVAVAAAGAVYFSALLTLKVLCSLANGPTPSGDLLFYIARAATLAVVAFTAGKFGARWIQSESVWSVARWDRRQGLATASEFTQPATRRGMLVRLVWQSWQQSRAVLGCMLVALVLGTAFAAMNDWPTWLFWLPLPAVIGAFAFFFDQSKQQHRFFSEHGISPSVVWLARVGSSFLLCLPWFGFLALASVTDFGVVQRPGNRDELFQFPTDAIMLGLLMFAWAQWSSLVFRQGVVGLVMGLVVGPMLSMWILLLHVMGIPDWLGAYPIVALFLIASRIRAPGWLAERDSWRQGLAYAAGFAAVLSVWVAGLAAHRAWEIPRLGEGANIAAGTTGIALPRSVYEREPAAWDHLLATPSTAAVQTADKYRALFAEAAQLPSHGMAGMAGPPVMASGSLPGDGAASALPDVERSPVELEARRKVVDRFVVLSRAAAADFVPDPLGLPENMYQASSLVDRVIEEAQARNEAGDAAAALECLLAVRRCARHLQVRGDRLRLTQALVLEQRSNEALVAWAADKKRTAEAIEELLVILNQPAYSYSPDLTSPRLRFELSVFGLIDLHAGAWSHIDHAENDVRHSMLQRLPWERERSRRLFTYLGTMPAAAGGSPTVRGWLRNTLLGEMAPEESLMLEPLARSYTVPRSALRLRLQLHLYKKQHDAWPESLEELEEMLPGQVALHPLPGEVWQYRPLGRLSDDPETFVNEEPLDNIPHIFISGPRSSGEVFLLNPPRISQTP